MKEYEHVSKSVCRDVCVYGRVCMCLCMHACVCGCIGNVHVCACAYVRGCMHVVVVFAYLEVVSCAVFFLIPLID